MSLSDTERLEGAHSWVQKMFVEPNVTANFNLDDLKAAFAAVDAWADANQTSYVASLPQPFKANSSPAQKALLLAFVAMKRGGLI